MFAKKYAIAKKEIHPGKILLKEDICYKRVDRGFVSKDNIENLLGSITLKKINKEEPIEVCNFKKIENLGLVAVRLKSSRLKRKALLDIDGKPLIRRVYDNLLSSKKLDKVIMCTSIDEEDDELCEYFEKNNIPYFRGSRLNVIDRFLSCAEKYNISPKNIIRLTGDNCFTSTEEMDRLIEHHNLKKADYSTLTNLPSGSNSEVISFECLKVLNDIVEDGDSSEYMTWMLDDPEFFKVNKIRCLDKFNLKIRLSCDTIEDYNLIVHLFKNKVSDIDDVINYYNKNKNVFLKNSNIKQISKEDVKNINLNKRKKGS